MSDENVATMRAIFEAVNRGGLDDAVARIPEALVVRVGGLRARGKGSGAEVTARGTQVWRFREGTPISVRLYQSKAEALEAIGLCG